MEKNFNKCLEIILHHEGGYVNHPRDPGGETNFGVTKRVYQEWGGTKNMEDLTKEDVAPIYEKNYWLRAKCNQLPSGLDLAVMDWSVNSGVGRAVKKLQQMIGTVADGGIGPNTLKTLDEYIEHHGLEQTIKSYKNTRQEFYESLSTFDTFGKGWTRRNEETEKIALEMI
jgi:lysozyme family protein